jgi:hypothetical protein
VIIFLGDGDANVEPPNISASNATNECHAAISAAAATAAGSWVYSIA